MSIEEELFSGYVTDENKLADFGFTPENGRLVYKKDLTVDDFQIVIEYNSAFKGRIIDLSTGEEYVNYRLGTASGYSAEIKDKFVNALTEIRDSCCENRHFKSSQAQRTAAYIQERYGVQPEFLWKKFPSYAAFRKTESKKWFALIGSISRCKVDKNTSSDEKADLLDIKIDGEKIKALLEKNGYFPAYHMNKKSWITVLFDNGLNDEEIKSLVDESYNNV